MATTVTATAVTTTTSSAAPPPSPITHFSHPHPLDAVVFVPEPGSICCACGVQSSGLTYTCLPCTFTLHQSCAELPPLVAHPAHPDCHLTLLSTAPYPGGVFSCDACRRRGDGWCYHCTRCEYDLHVLCACRPRRIRHPAHAGPCGGELELMFEGPYGGAGGFACDVCRRVGARQWLYHCAACEFDVHLDCAAGDSVLRQRMQELHGGGASSPPRSSTAVIGGSSYGVVGRNNSMHGGGSGGGGGATPS